MKTICITTNGLMLICLMVLSEQIMGATVHTVKIEARPYAVHLRAYAQVEPRAILTLTATASGNIGKLFVTPGAHVTATQRLATLSGPEYLADLTTAEAHYQAAQLVFKDLQHNFPEFSSAQDLATAQSSLTASHAALLRIQAAGVIRTPVAGTVLSIAISDGSRVYPGAIVLRLLPDKNLWVRATLYGQAANELRPGLPGIFHGDGPSSDLKVRVQAVIPPLSVGGGVQVICVAQTRNPGWSAGESGTLEIAASTSKPVPAVPNSALVMDQGSWWVLIADTHGLHRTQVEIGPSSGDWTFVLHGLKAGERVVAVNAYLLFHADISRQYSPPD